MRVRGWEWEDKSERERYIYYISNKREIERESYKGTCTGLERVREH